MSAIGSPWLVSVTGSPAWTAAITSAVLLRSSRIPTSMCDSVEHGSLAETPAEDLSERDCTVHDHAPDRRPLRGQLHGPPERVPARGDTASDAQRRRHGHGLVGP